MRSILALSLLLTLGSWTPSSAGWTADGTQLCGPPAYPNNFAIAQDGVGGVFATWDDERGGYPPDLFFQRVLGSGSIAPGWPLNGVAIFTSLYAQYPGPAIPDDNGGIVATWLVAGLGTTVRAIKVTADGLVAPGWPDTGVLILSGRRGPDFFLCSSDGAGGVLVVAADGETGPLARLFVFRVMHDGSLAAGWPQGGVEISSAYSRSTGYAVTADGAGGIYVAWPSGAKGALGIRLQRVLGDGSLAPGWPAGGVQVTSAEAMAWALCLDGAGGVYVSRSTGGISGTVASDLYLHRYNPDGTVAASWPAQGLLLCGLQDDQDQAQMTTDGVGGAYVAWQDFRSFTRAQTFAAHITPQGTRAPGWPENGLLVSTTPSYQFFARIASDGMGGIYVTWEDDGPAGGDSRVYAQHLTAGGTLAPGWPTDGIAVSPGGPGDQTYPQVISDGNLGAIVVWHEGAVPSLWAQKLVGGGIVAVQLALVSAEVEPGRVTLRWRATEAGGASAVIERRDAIESAAWREIGRMSVSGTGEIAFVDTGVEPGRSYEYRAGVFADGAMHYSAAERVDVPLRLEFALGGASPNPTVGPLRVRLTLATTAPARLTLLDIAGRVVRERDVTNLGAGRHVVDLTPASTIAPGVYLLRLVQGNLVGTTRVSVIR